MVAQSAEHWFRVCEIVGSNSWSSQTNHPMTYKIYTGAQHYQDRVRTGCLSVRIMWLSGISVHGPDGLVSQWVIIIKLPWVRTVTTGLSILIWPWMLLGCKTANKHLKLKSWFYLRCCLDVKHRHTDTPIVGWLLEFYIRCKTKSNQYDVMLQWGEGGGWWVSSVG